MSKNILIVPAPSGSNPKIYFSGSNSSSIYLEVLEDGSVSFIGSVGTLFNITDGLSGSLMSVNDISGLPKFEVFSWDRVDVNGDLYVDGNLFIESGSLAKYLVDSSDLYDDRTLVDKGWVDSITGSLEYVLNLDGTGVFSGSEQVDYTQLQNIPVGIVSGSLIDSASYALNVDRSLLMDSASYAPTNDGVFSSSEQVDYNSIQNQPTIIATASYYDSSGDTVLSSSYALTASYAENTSVETWDNISGKPSGIVSSSTQVDYEFIQNVPDNIFSGSYSDLFGIPSGIVSGSLIDSASYALDVDRTLLMDSASFAETASYFDLPSNILSGSVSYLDLTDIPTNIFSGSHSDLPGLANDDHTQYYNTTRLNTWISSSVVPNAVSASYAPTILPSGIVSESSQIDHDQTTNFETNEHFTQENITTVGTVTTGDVSAILPSGVLSGSIIDSASFVTDANIAYINKENTFIEDQYFNKDILVDGNIIANQFIISSSVTYMTQSFSSGSTMFGDSIDDTHIFTGSVYITGSLLLASTALYQSDLSSTYNDRTLVDKGWVDSITGSLEYVLNLTGTGVFSGSEQVDYTQLQNIPVGLVSGSSQIDHDQTTNFETNEHFLQSAITEVGTVISGNVTAILPAGVVSGSSQINYSGLTNIPTGIVSSSEQVDYDQLQNIPVGIVSGSLIESASYALDVDRSLLMETASYALNVEGVVGYWSKSGTDLSPSTAGDDILLSSYSERIKFGDGDTSIYEYSDDELYFNVGGSIRLSLYSSAVSCHVPVIPVSNKTIDLGATIAYWDNAYVDRLYIDDSSTYLDINAGNLTFTDAITGTVTLASLANSDTWTKTGTNLHPTTAGDDILLSGSSERILFGDGDSGIFESSDDVINIFCGGTTLFSLSSPQVYFNTTILPNGDNTFDLGSNSFVWRSIHVNDVNTNNISASGDLYLPGISNAEQGYLLYYNPDDNIVYYGSTGSLGGSSQYAATASYINPLRAGNDISDVHMITGSLYVSGNVIIDSDSQLELGDDADSVIWITGSVHHSGSWYFEDLDYQSTAYSLYYNTTTGKISYSSAASGSSGNLINAGTDISDVHRITGSLYVSGNIFIDSDGQIGLGDSADDLIWITGSVHHSGSWYFEDLDYQSTSYTLYYNTTTGKISYSPATSGSSGTIINAGTDISDVHRITGSLYISGSIIIDASGPIKLGDSIDDNIWLTGSLHLNTDNTTAQQHMLYYDNSTGEIHVATTGSLGAGGGGGTGTVTNTGTLTNNYVIVGNDSADISIADTTVNFNGQGITNVDTITLNNGYNLVGGVGSDISGIQNIIANDITASNGLNLPGIPSTVRQYMLYYDPTSNAVSYGTTGSLGSGGSGTSPWIQSGTNISPVTAGSDILLATTEHLAFIDTSNVIYGSATNHILVYNTNSTIDFSNTAITAYRDIKMTSGNSKTLDLGATDAWWDNVYVDRLYVDAVSTYIDVDGTGMTFTDGTGTYQLSTLGGGVSVANQSNNRIITATATADALNAESALTFTGTDLVVGGTSNGQDGTYVIEVGSATLDQNGEIALSGNRTSDTSPVGLITWNNAASSIQYNKIASIAAYRNEDNDAGKLEIGVANTSGVTTTDLTITDDGISTSVPLYVNGGGIVAYGASATTTRITLSNGNTSVASLYYYNETSATMQDFKIGTNTTNEGIYWDDSENRVGILDDTPSYTLDVNGDIRATGNIIAYSDIRGKNIISEIDSAYSKIDELDTFIYTYKNKPELGLQYGLSAQNLMSVFPHAVTYKDEEDEYSIRLLPLIAINTKALQEAKTEIDELKSEVAELTKLVTILMKTK